MRTEIAHPAVRGVFALFIAAGLATLATPGCVPSEQTLRFDQSNQVFIEQTVDMLDAAQAVAGVVPRGSRVAFVPLDRHENPPAHVRALVEDQMIQLLMQKGLKVLERERTAVVNLIGEGRQKTYTLSSPKGGFDTTGRAYVATQLRSADYLCSYRILECGVNVVKTAKTREGYVQREGLVKLHVRVQTVADGEIVFAKNFTALKQEELAASLAPALKNFHYVFVPHAYPPEDAPAGPPPSTEGAGSGSPDIWH